jgi:hypothetical protein
VLWIRTHFFRIRIRIHWQSSANWYIKLIKEVNIF